MGTTNRVTQLQVQCCRCKRLRLDNNNWQRVPMDAYGDAISHGLCPACYERAKAEVQSLAHFAELSPLTATMA